jgi:hypothetical protein
LNKGENNGLTRQNICGDCLIIVEGAATVTVMAMWRFLMKVCNITAALSFNILRKVVFLSWFQCLFWFFVFFLEQPINFTPILTSPWGISFWSVFLFFTGFAVVVFAFFPFEF